MKPEYEKYRRWYPIPEERIIKESGYSARQLYSLRIGRVSGKYRYDPVLIEGIHWDWIGPAVVYSKEGRKVVMERAIKNKKQEVGNE